MKMPRLFKPKLERKIGTVGIWFRDLLGVIETTVDRVVEFDISNLETINSEEISALVKTHLRLRSEGRNLCLLNPTGTIQEVFELTRMDRLIQLRLTPPENDQINAPKIVTTA